MEECIELTRLHVVESESGWVWLFQILIYIQEVRKLEGKLSENISEDEKGVIRRELQITETKRDLAWSRHVSEHTIIQAVVCYKVPWT